MKTPASASFWSAVLAKFFVIFSLVSLSFTPAAYGIGSPSAGLYVTYSPNTLQTINVEVPNSWSYDLTITSPLLTGSTTITPVVTVLSCPASVSSATAATYLSFSQPSLTYSASAEAKTITVSFSAPVGAAGTYKYFITTSGWPSGSIDEGTYVNAFATAPASLVAPTIAISSPENNTVYQHAIGGAAVSVPVTISTDATESAPVLTLVAELSGTTTAGATIATSTIALTTASLGTSHAEGVATLSVSEPGTYTITSTATNSVGSSVASVVFVVADYVPPPTITITAPSSNSTYSYVRGLTSVSVPYTYVGVSFQGGVTSLTGKLDGNEITNATTSGLGALTATGTGTFAFSAATLNGVGQHTIDATVVDAYGTASASTTFTIVELVPTITTDIANPLDGAVIPLPPDASPLNLAYNFTTTTTYGAPITAITATLTSGETLSSLTLESTSGLNTAAAAGGGTLTNVTAGTYTVGATGSNATLSLSAYDSATFAVTPPPPPAVAFTTSPSASYTVLTGYPQSIPVAFTTTSTATTANPGPAYISAQVLTLDGQVVTLTTNTAAGIATTATGTATLSVPAPAAGTTVTHVLTVTGTDAYGQVATAQVSFDVTGKDPEITIAINPEIVSNSPYTLPYAGSISIPFTFTGNITSGATVDTIVGALGSSAVTITSTTGLGTSSTATASGVLTISTPGTYTLTATDTNTPSGVTATTSVQFVVKACQTLPPLTVAITQAPAASYTLIKGCSALSIPITFVGKSNSGNTGGYVSTLSATLDGKAISLASVSGLTTATGTATANLSVCKAGTHTLVVKATDKWSQTATATATFVVVIQNPVISVVIDTPSTGTTYVLPGGSSGGCGSSSSSSLSIPFKFTSTITTGATIDSISAVLNGSCVSVTSSGLGTSTAIGTGTLVVKQAGTYKLTAKAYDCTSGVSASTSITFTVRAPNPPTVVIALPTQSSYTLTCGSTLSVPFAFTASGETAAGITSLSATLDGCCASVTSTGLGTNSASGSGTLAVTSGGTHKLIVTAKDAAGTATASTSFTVTVVQPPKYTCGGKVYHDINCNGSFDTDDYGLPDVKVTLCDSRGYGLATVKTDSSGCYSFSMPAGSYIVRVEDVNGMCFSTDNEAGVKIVNTAVTASHIGCGLKFSALRGMCANGYSTGYWKTNIDKAIAGKTSGCQVGASTLNTYTNKMCSLALEPYAGQTLSTSSSTLGCSSSSAGTLLSKQLVAAEYNYLNGACIGGDSRLTHAFITYAESVLKRQSCYSSTYLTFVKDWCEAYNTSCGGKVYGPLP